MMFTTFIETYGFIIIPCGIGVILAVLWFWHQYRLLIRLNEKGVVTDAKIVRHLIVTSDEYLVYPMYRRVKPAKQCAIEYQFRTEESGATFRGAQNISAEKYNLLQVGDTVKVRYFPESPITSRLADQDADNFAFKLYAAAIIGLILGYLGSVLGLFIFFRRSIF